jgi:Flp pilus assembly CpaF family ATPase
MSADREGGGRRFEGEEAVRHVIERIVVPLGLRVDESSPWVDARLSDGSRVQTNFHNAHFREQHGVRRPERGRGYPPTTR